MTKEINVKDKTYTAVYCDKVAVAGSKQSTWYDCEKCVFDRNDLCIDIFNENDKCMDSGKTIFWVEKKEISKAHTHAEAMMEYAKDMATDASIIWQYLANDDNSGWVDLVAAPGWVTDGQYRRKPIQEVDIYINVSIDGNELFFTISDADKADIKLTFNNDGSFKDVNKNDTAI